ncbi:tyrosine-type recombinase/integrase [Duganella sp. FT80W]|uniref:Tyrosine-type recombinase/integrase n=1 Tax=Duganella guangzhouensis TaxID=2666084 RepID=A0A6I2L0Z9_9BURK|nr:site-specific integrase [Duganella guangzhouensis]MRW91831.1 tyrosine-type recombinase/integrase [Duganella guangzhouensis]
MDTDDIDRYLDAANRSNTNRSYQGALRHFEVEWGGFLPATPDSVARYLAHYADSLAINTLQQRLAALAKWHNEQGFADPTKAPIVRKVLKGIRTLHPAQEKQARPIQLEQLRSLVDWLDSQIADVGIGPASLRYRRDKALVLLGFWRGFRGDELTRLCIEHVKAVAGEGMSCFLPFSKGDRQAHGMTFRAPALLSLCPVDAYLDWIAAAKLTDGPVFRAIDRWGNVGTEGLHINSLIPLLRSLLDDAAIPHADEYTSHSLRRGFANWATGSGWDMKTLMEYVGWRDVHSAMRYVEAADPFASVRQPNE